MRRTVLITGGSSGIGKAMVKAFAAKGYLVWFTFNKGKKRARKLLELHHNKNIQAFHLELGNRESHKKLIKELPGSVDILINNAGLGSKTVENVSPEVHEQDAVLMMVNAVGSLWLTRSLINSMLERDFGKIIFISSVGGGISQFPKFHIADGMSKAALAYLGRHLQALYSMTPIDIFTICPGATETPMLEASTLSKLNKAARKKLIDSLPGGRLIDPAEIANLSVFLCTDDARVLRGAVLDASLGLGVNPCF